jgi:hypothetical protein
VACACGNLQGGGCAALGFISLLLGRVATLSQEDGSHRRLRWWRVIGAAGSCRSRWRWLSVWWLCSWSPAAVGHAWLPFAGLERSPYGRGWSGHVGEVVVVRSWWCCSFRPLLTGVVVVFDVIVHRLRIGVASLF